MTSPAGAIAAVILAAGGSTRLGQPKQLLPLGERPLLDCVVQTCRAANVDQRYIVLGFASDEIQRAIDLDGFEVIDNPNFERGQSTSLSAAIKSLPDKVPAVIFVLGDQPFQERSVIDELADSYRDHPAAIIQPRYREGPGNPVLFDRSLFSQLLEISGDTGARPLLQKLKDRIRQVDVSSISRPVDVDTLQDYHQLLHETERQRAPEEA